MKFPIRETILLIIITAMIACLVVPPLPVATWDGGFELTVTPHSRSGRTISKLTFFTTPRRESAEFYADDSNAEVRAGFDTCERRGDDFVVRVTTSGKMDFFGREFDYAEMGNIAICATYEDGSQSACAMEVPKGRGPRRMDVTLP